MEGKKEEVLIRYVRKRAQGGRDIRKSSPRPPRQSPPKRPAGASLERTGDLNEYIDRQRALLPPMYGCKMDVRSSQA